MRRTGHTMCVKIDGPDRILKTNTPTQKSTHLPNKDEFASERIKDRKQNKEITEVSFILYGPYKNYVNIA